MNSYNTYFKFLKADALKILLISIIFTIGHLCIAGIYEILPSIKNNSDELIRYANQVIAMVFLLCIVYGATISARTFSGAMSIRGNRVGFIKAFILWSILISIFTAIFSLTSEMGFKFILEMITKKDVLIVPDMAGFDFGNEGFNMVPVNISFIWFMKTIFFRFLTNILMISIGFMFGAIGYRLKLRTNLILFVLLPILLIISIVSIGLQNQDMIIDAVYYIMNITLYIGKNLIILLIIETIGVVIFTLVGVRFLIKAPIKDYAHDLA